jgi:alpha-amylase/alpha-mannosidase (GH57 family)
MAENSTGAKPHPLRYFIIHGHFYQPPRENPWIDAIETQPSALPAHDWNERVFDECYRPNAYSRILDSKGMIAGIHNNYAALSFNFGPTLFRWLEDAHPETARRILEGDRESVRRLGGFGNALAQVYNHTILPLASPRDQRTQIRWARSFFRSRFGREPQGMWLAETAINMETVRALIEENIEFVVLSPTQAEAFRELDQGGEWIDCSNGAIDTRRVYRVYPRDSRGRRMDGSLDVFFFDEGLSRGVSFEGILTSASLLGNRIAACFDTESLEQQVVTIATDGETFGHHKPFGDMCLAYLFAREAKSLDMHPVNFAWFRSRNPARYEVALKNASGEGCAWSCAHGTGRWIRDCGCQTGGPDWWNQQWRTPLRTALDTLQGHVDEAFAAHARELGIDPWRLRNESAGRNYAWDSVAFKEIVAASGAPKRLSAESLRTTARLVQAQKYMQFAYTSCGWFFSDISGIEPMQNLAYAGRALQLGLEGAAREEAAKAFLHELDGAVSNIDGKTGRELFDAWVAPSLHHLPLMCFNAAAQRIIGRKKKTIYSLYGYRVRLKAWPGSRKERRSVTGLSATVENKITAESGTYVLLVFHTNGAEMRCLIAPSSDGAAEPALLDSHREEVLGRAGALEMRLSDLCFESRIQIAAYFEERIARRTVETYRAWIQRNAPVIESLALLENRLPDHLHGPVAYLLTSYWNEKFSKLREPGCEQMCFDQLLEIWKRAKRYGVSIDYAQSSLLLEDLLIEGIRELATGLCAATAQRVRALMNIVDHFGVPVRKSLLEDAFYGVLRTGIQQLHDELLGQSHRDHDRISLLLQMIGLARRMNFNTDRFVIPRRDSAASESIS